MKRSRYVGALLVYRAKPSSFALAICTRGRKGLAKVAVGMQLIKMAEEYPSLKDFLTVCFPQLNTGQLGDNYAGNNLRVEQAWMQGLTGCNVTVTIVDDGQ